MIQIEDEFTQTALMLAMKCEASGLDERITHRIETAGFNLEISFTPKVTGDGPPKPE